MRRKVDITPITDTLKLSLQHLQELELPPNLPEKQGFLYLTRKQLLALLTVFCLACIVCILLIKENE